MTETCRIFYRRLELAIKGKGVPLVLLGDYGLCCGLFVNLYAYYFMT
jgi:hypothetical protein